MMGTPTSRCHGWPLLLVAFGLSAPTWADEGQAFRVCADPNNLPFSAKTLNGLENKIAGIWADEVGLPLEYTWFPQRRGFVRNTIKALDESGEYKCDVVMGVADGFELLLTTKPYYRSTYALVYLKGRDLSDIKTGQDFVDLPPEVRSRLRIGAFTPTPGTKWLARHGMTEQIVAFPAMSGDPQAYPGEIIEKELVDGRLDAAVVWGPIAGYFAKQARPAELEVVPLESEPGIKFDFSISAAVRYGDGERKQQLEELISKTAPAIREVLLSYNVPLLAIDQETRLARDDDD